MHEFFTMQQTLILIIFTGDLYIRNSNDDKDIYFQTDDGSGGLSNYLWLDGSQSASGNLYVKYPDNSRITLGDGSDLYFWHDGTDTKMQNSNGDLVFIQATDDKDLIFKCDDGSGGTTEYFKLDGSLATHDGSSTTALSTVWGDNSKVVVGDSADGRYWHDGTDTYLQNTTGDLIIQNFADDKDIIFKSDDGSGGTTTYFFLDGRNSHTNFQLNARWVDSAKAQFGNSGDFNIFHNGTNSYLENDTGDLYIRNNSDDKDIYFQTDDWLRRNNNLFYV